ncbi:hypothetical protein ACP70R_004112 [Stipagrostis hirtigluma subsp. patula]
MTGLEAALASGLLKIAGNKLVSLISSKFASISGVTKDLSELQDILREITSWLSTVHDTEIDSGPLFIWVMKLKDVAYDIDDLLDEVHLEAEKHKIDSDDNHSIGDCFCSKPKSFLFRYKMAHKIKAIKVRFAAIVKQRSDINTILHNLPVDPLVTSRSWATEELSLLSNVEESKIPVRDKEKDEIISRLVESSGDNGWIVSIVGLGGSGKTTLAKHICHDNKVKEHFNDTIFRIHVSQEFDMEKLISKLFEAVTKQKSDIHARQHMVAEISNKLSGKKFLLVLDDAWKEDKNDWEQFMLHVNSGAPGSKVLLTTRDKKVAEAVKSTHIFHLTFLSEADSWSLFLKCSGLAEEDMGSEFIGYGKEIVRRCGGVPLAIKTLGGVLCDKRELNTWKAIRESDLWNVDSINDRVFASLKLSYFHLADNLKQCFTLCSVFPKGYKIVKDHLIAQWIAHGFINLMNKEQPEDIGSDYFDSLVKVGFLQDSSQIWDNNQLVYKMHDLIHDLTRLILQDEIVTSLLKNITTNCTRRCRYLSLMSSTEKVDSDLFDKVRALYVYGGEPSFGKSIKKSSYIRSVILQSTVLAQFLPFILKSKYLGYLEICHVSCTELPEAISGCWNLQGLHIMHCRGLVRLPESIGKLKKLRTLELLMCTDFESLPQSIGDCQELQCLQLYFCSSLREIPNSVCKLGNLRVLNITASLAVQQLPPKLIGEPGNLQTLNLSGCSHLGDLPRKFSCRTLRNLVLSNTNVTVLPQWVTLIGTLECIDLEYCTELVELPTGIGNLERLKVLNIKGCWRLCCMPLGFRRLVLLRRLDLFVIGCGDNDARILELENLEMLSGQLEITNLRYLKDQSDAEKACLKQKKNLQCLKLTWWSSSGTEEEFVYDMEQELGVLDALEPPPELMVLEISGYHGPHLPCWMRKQCGSSNLDCMSTKTNPPRFHGLTQLMLEHVPNLKHMRGIVEFPSLKTLNLHGMPSLEEMWTTSCGSEILEEEVGVQCCFPVLSALFIWGCPKLNVIPYFPPSLKWLRLGRSNEQLMSPGSLACCHFHPRVSKSSSSCSALAELHLKKLKLEEMAASSSGWELLQHLTTLESLEIRLCNDLRELPQSMRSLLSLKRLHVDGCSTLDALPEWLGELCSLRELSVVRTPKIARIPQSMERLTSLVELKIVGWGNLNQLPEAMQHLISLQVLSLEGCSALTILPHWIGQLSALRLLRIDRCSALQSLPQSIKRLTALQNLSITGSPGLARRYKQGDGDDWHLVSHIAHVTCY